MLYCVRNQLSASTPYWRVNSFGGDAHPSSQNELASGLFHSSIHLWIITAVSP